MGRSRDQEIRRSSPSLLVGKTFDDRGNPMTPMHANKGRVRYRDYVSHALLRGRKAEAGAVGRVPAPDIEQLVIGAMRAAFNQERDVSDGVLVQSRLNKAIVHRDRIEITLRRNEAAEAGAALSRSTISTPFAATLPLRKDVSHSPTRRSAMNDSLRISLLTAIARSQNRIETIINASAVDFGVLANREKLAERHLRFLAPLACLSPRIISGHRRRPRAR
jgi:site-specific DNA recombinase